MKRYLNTQAYVWLKTNKVYEEHTDNLPSFIVPGKENEEANVPGQMHLFVLRNSAYYLKNLTVVNIKTWSYAYFHI